MIRKMERSTTEEILKEVSKVLQDAAAPIFARHPCSRSSDFIDDIVFNYGDAPRPAELASSEVRKGSGEAVDDYNMSVISPMSTDKYACNVYGAFVEYLNGELSDRISRANDRLSFARRSVERAEADLEEIRSAVNLSWVMARIMADDVRSAIEQYDDCSASDMEYWASDIEKTLGQGERNKDGSKMVFVDGILVEGNEE